MAPVHWDGPKSRARRRKREAYVSTEPTQAEANARFPRENEDSRRTEGSQAAPGEGTKANDGVSERGAPSDMTAAKLPPKERLKQQREFQALFRQGEKFESKSFLLLWKKGGGGRRAGFKLGRHIRGAVKRNRARRRVREAYRVSRDLLPAGVQLLFIIRGGVLRARFPDLLREVEQGLRAVDARGKQK